MKRRPKKNRSKRSVRILYQDMSAKFMGKRQNPQPENWNERNGTGMAFANPAYEQDGEEDLF